LTDDFGFGLFGVSFSLFTFLVLDLSVDFGIIEGSLIALFISLRLNWLFRTGIFDSETAKVGI